MGYWLGIDAGSTFTAAAVCRRNGGRWGPPEIVALGARAAAVSSVVYLDGGGQVVVGEAAERRVVTDPDRVVRGFKRRIGDEVPIVVGGVAYAAPEIAAMVIRWVVEQVTAREGCPAAGIVLTHPAAWGAYKVEVLTRALGATGLPEIKFCTEPEAAAAGYAMQERIEPGRTVAVYDLGGGTFDAAVVRKTAAGGFCVLGQPQGLEQLGGVDFDDAVFGHVLATVPALSGLDGADPATLAATAALRRECTEAKEALSADTEVTIPVLAPGIQSRVRLVRAEFEDMIRPQVGETVQALRRALQSAQLEPQELDVVLLVGGSSRVPLVAQLVSAELGRPVAVDADPKAAIALGAALLAVPPDQNGLLTETPLTETPVQLTGPNLPTPSPAHLPERPTLTATPRDGEPGDSDRRANNSRRAKQVAFAAVLALGTAAGVVSVPFLIAHSDPNPSANAGTASAGAPPAPGAPEEGTTSSPGAANSANPVARAGTRGDRSSPKAGSGGPVRTTLPAAPGQPASGVVERDPVQASPSASTPNWVTNYTQTTTRSGPTPTTTPATTPPPTSTQPPQPPATTKEAPPASTTATAPPVTTTPAAPSSTS